MSSTPSSSVSPNELHSHYDMFLQPHVLSDNTHIAMWTPPSESNYVTPSMITSTLWLGPYANVHPGEGLPPLHETDDYVRRKYNIPYGREVNLWALPDNPALIKGKGLICSLIELAIWGSEMKRLTAGEIYEVVQKRYPGCHFEKSIRHHLSFNAIFHRLEKPLRARGSHWTLDIRNKGKHRAVKRTPKKDKRHG